MSDLREKITLGDIEIGDRFCDEKGVLMEIVNFNDSQTVVYRPAGSNDKSLDREMGKTPVLLAGIRRYIIQENKRLAKGQQT